MSKPANTGGKTARKSGGSGRGEGHGHEEPAGTAATATGAVPQREIETAEFLESLGWQRLTKCFYSQRRGEEETEEREIVQDLKGVLWLVSEWHGKSGVTHRAARRQISRETACSIIAKANIPAAFHYDFKECVPADDRLETAIQEARAFFLLMAESRFTEWTGSRGEAIKAGVNSLAIRLGDELAAAFYVGHEES